MYDIMQIKNEGEKMELYSTYIETDKFDEVMESHKDKKIVEEKQQKDDDVELL